MATTSNYDAAIDYLVLMENEAVAELDLLQMRANRLEAIASPQTAEMVQLRQAIKSMTAHVNHLQTLVELCDVDIDVMAETEDE